MLRQHPEFDAGCQRGPLTDTGRSVGPREEKLCREFEAQAVRMGGNYQQAVRNEAPCWYQPGEREKYRFWSHWHRGDYCMDGITEEEYGERRNGA